MKRWKQPAVLAVIVGASFVLLVTVLPQFASGIGLGALANRLTSSTSCSGSGSSGSSSSSSSQCTPQPGTVTGTVTITGAPAGFSPAFSGAGACPTSTPAGQVCPNPVYALANGGTYSLSLPAGKWHVTGFYENNAYGGAFLGDTKTVVVPAGGTVTRNLAVPYQVPAAIRGTVRVTHVPSGIQIQSISVLLCPSYAPYNGQNPSSIACVTSYGQQAPQKPYSGTYQVTGLPPGSWTAYPGYCTEFGCAINAKAGSAVTLTSGATTVADLTTPFLTPDEGILTGTVTVTGAPAGFSDPVGVAACQPGGGEYCNAYPDVSGSSGGTYTLLLANGTWSVNGFYLAPVFDNAIAGAIQSVTISGGKTTTLNLTVPYQKLGTAKGTIDVTGVPPHTSVTSYTVLACPAATPWTGGLQPEGCVNEYSGPGGYGFGRSDANGLNKVGPPAAAPTQKGNGPYNVYSLPTLTKGAWILYPGYQTVYESYTDPSGSTVNVVPGQAVTTRLTVPYQTPTVGIVQGTVVVTGAPENGFESGVEACSAIPTATSCQNEQEAYSQEDGRYQLQLNPGTWWVSGFAQVFGFGSGPNQSTTAPREITVRPGSSNTENFTVRVGG
jgi:hypothetical protein